MDASVSDVSDVFWQFVHDVTSMTYAQLYKTGGFLALSDARGSLALRCGILTVDVEAALPEGVVQEEGGHRYLFPDVSSLMRNTTQMVIEPRMRRRLEECLRRIVCFVEVADLAADLEHQDLDDRMT